MNITLIQAALGLLICGGALIAPQLDRRLAIVSSLVFFWLAAVVVVAAIFLEIQA